MVTMLTFQTFNMTYLENIATVYVGYLLDKSRARSVNFNKSTATRERPHLTHFLILEFEAYCRVSGRILYEGTPGRGSSWGGLGGVPPRPEKKINSKVSETNFGDSRVPVC